MAPPSQPAEVRLDAVARRGLRAPSLPPAFARELNEGDLPMIQAGKPDEPSIAGLTIRECTARHHMLAMMLASGANNARAAFVTGFTPATIAKVKDNPLFQDLLSYYVEQKSEEFKDFYRKAAMVGMTAVDEIGRRLETDPDSVTNKELLAIAEKLLDRTILPSKAAGVAQAPVALPPVQFIQFVEAPRRDEVPVPPAMIEAKARLIPTEQKG